MSLLPYMFYNWPRVPSLLETALVPDDVFSSAARAMSENLQQLQQGTSIKADKDKFQVSVDVQHFAPEEISVRTANGEVIIEGKHEEKQDQHGYVSRHFVRRYALPEGCQVDGVESRLSSDGVLTVTAPRKPPAIKGERSIPIQHTGPVRKEIKDHSATADAPKPIKGKKK